MHDARDKSNDVLYIGALVDCCIGMCFQFIDIIEFIEVNVFFAFFRFFFCYGNQNGFCVRHQLIDFEKTLNPHTIQSQSGIRDKRYFTILQFFMAKMECKMQIEVHECIS